MDVSVRREKVVHNDKMDFSAVRDLDTVQSIELREEGIGVVHDVGIIILEDFAKQLMFGVVNSLDDIFVVARKVEE